MFLRPKKETGDLSGLPSEDQLRFPLLTLGELEARTRALLAGLLALLHSRVSRQEPALLQLLSLGGIHLLDRPGDAVAQGSRLARGTAALDIGDDVVLDGWCIKPSHFDPQKKYPVLFHVYGEPAGQTVLDRWGGTLRFQVRMDGAD